MANPVSIVTGSVSVVQAIINLALKIKEKVETFRHNREDCRKIGELVDTVRDVAEGLRKSTEDAALVGGALKALQQSLERAWDLVVACQGKNAVLRALDADAIAVKLRRVYLDVSLNLSAVVLANGAYNTSKLADIYAIVATLRAEVAYNTRMLAKIKEIVVALPEHLRQEVARLVESYSDSTDDDDATYYQNESTWETKKEETKKTDDVVSTRGTEKTEMKKTDDVARTYSPSYAYYYPSNYGGYQEGLPRYTVPGHPYPPFFVGPGGGWGGSSTVHHAPTEMNLQGIGRYPPFFVGGGGSWGGASVVHQARTETDLQGRGPYPPVFVGGRVGWERASAVHQAPTEMDLQGVGPHLGRGAPRHGGIVVAAGGGWERGWTDSTGRVHVLGGGWTGSTERVHMQRGAYYEPRVHMQRDGYYEPDWGMPW